MSVVKCAISGACAVLVAAGLAACGSSDGGASATNEPAPAAEARAPFDTLSHEQRLDLMKHVVMPAMKAEFAAWEPGEFTEMNCKSCHGEGAKDKTFKMPNPRLPKLPADAAGWQKLEEHEPEAMKFMKETVVPRMAAMLGEAPYDPATGKGFGCFGCHTKRQ